MVVGNIDINGLGYQARPFTRNGQNRLVHRYIVEPTGASFRLSGRQRPEDLRSITPFIFPNCSLGLGRDRIDSDSAFEPDEYRRFFDATADTRWARGIYLPVQEENSAQSGLEVVRASASFKGNIWTIWEDDTGTDIVARKYTGSSTKAWDNGGAIAANAVPTAVIDLITQKTHLIAMFITNNDHVTSRSTDGASWSASSTAITANLLANDVTVHEDIDAGLLADIGGELVGIVWHEGNGTITFFSSTDAGDNWADESIDIASGNGPQGVVVIRGPDREDKLILATREGIHEIDTAPSTWTTRLIRPMIPNNDNGRRMVVGDDGAVWIAQGVDDDSPPIVYRMIVTDQGYVFDGVPNDFADGDGLPDEALGPIRWMAPANGMMYCSAGGGKSSRHARIWCHNGKGWHSVRRHGTANQKIEWIAASGDDDGLPRLHYAVRTGTAASDANFLGQPFVNPSSGVSINRETTGYVDLPYLDFALPLLSKAVLRVGINAQDLSSSTSGEYINVDYGSGADNAAATARGSFTDLGNFLSGTSTIDHASGAGLSVRSYALRVKLFRNSTVTDTPILKDVEIDVVPHIPVRQGFILRINLQETAQLEDKTTEEVITRLETARDLVTMPSFAYANISATRVKVVSLNWGDDVYSDGGGILSVPDAQALRRGEVEVVLEEVLA